MRRTLAIVLAVGLLFAGGCNRQRMNPAAPPATTQKADQTVDDLLNQVDQQFGNDAQPTEDED
jgi:outer membrane murein-binding lipoprotein Lpp